MRTGGAHRRGVLQTYEGALEGVLADTQSEVRHLASVVYHNVVCKRMPLPRGQALSALIRCVPSVTA